MRSRFSVSKTILIALFVLYTVLFFVFYMSIVPEEKNFRTWIIGTYPLVALFVLIFYGVHRERTYDSDYAAANSIKQDWQKLGHYEITPGPDFLERAALQRVSSHYEKVLSNSIRKAEQAFRADPMKINSLFALKLFSKDILSNWNLYKDRQVSVSAYLVFDFDCPYYSSDPIRYNVITLCCAPNIQSFTKIPDYPIFQNGSAEYEKYWPYDKASDFTLYIDDPDCYKMSKEILDPLPTSAPPPLVTVRGTLCKKTLRHVNGDDRTFLSLSECTVTKQ